MNLLPPFILSNLFLVAVWAFYEAALRNRRVFAANRFYLLAGSVLATLLPWLPWQVPIPAGSSGFPEIPVYLPYDPLSMPDAGISAETLAAGSPVNWPLTIYLSVVILLSLACLALFARMIIWRKIRPVTRWEDRYRVVVMNERWPAFSFFDTIFYPEPFDPANPGTLTILEHERIHARQYHSVDNILMLVFRIIFFFNPAIHLLAARLRLTHEYLADRATAGNNRNEYTRLLISHQFLVPGFVLMHSFNNQSFLKRRLNMLMNSNKSRRAGWIYLLAAPLLAGMVLMSGWSASAQDKNSSRKAETQAKVEKQLLEMGFSRQADGIWSKDGITVTLADESKMKEKIPEYLTQKYSETQIKEGKEVFLIVEDMPTFQGGNMDHFRKSLMQRIKYPVDAKEQKITGTVYASFIVNKEGKVSDPAITKGVSPSLDNAVIEALKSSPDWEPGRQRGQKVNVAFTIPVSFMLDGDKKKEPGMIAIQKPGEDKPTIIHMEAEEMPEFQGGGIEEFARWVAKNVKYPAEAMEKGLTGTVTVKFVVDLTGRVVMVKAEPMGQPSLEKAAEEAVKASPAWKPGKQKGEAVNVAFKMPVQFRVQ